MDINMIRETRSLSLQRCYQCRDVNHLVRDCPHHMNICQFTSEQWEELIKDLLALKDVVPLEESCPLKEEDFA